MGDNDDWFAATDDLPPEPASLLKKSSTQAEESAPEASEAADKQVAPEPDNEPEGEYLDPDKLLLFKHWIRPRFLPYKYLTDYRKNYYDDILDYLDKRIRGISREIPVPQTWAERALRTYTKYSNKVETYRRKLEDTKLIQETRPRYLEYKYLYNYRRNYYDDVLAAIDSRKNGYRGDIPRPQSWAQRILRTYNDPFYKMEAFDRFLDDVKLVTRTEIGRKIYSYQRIQSFNKRYTTKF